MAHTHADELTPFFATEANPESTRRMLLVFFEFAPSAEVGVLRWLSLSQFGAERQWAIDVVTMNPEFMGTLDETRLTQLPRGVRLFGFDGQPPAWYRWLLAPWRRTRADSREFSGAGMIEHLDARDPESVAASADTTPQWRRAIRSVVDFAQADAFASRAAAVGLKLFDRNRYDLIVSSGPPNAAHDAARIVATRAGLPFVMDMRDPWSDESAMPEDFRSRTWQRLAQRHEQSCVSAATLVVVTSAAHAALQERKYGALRGRVQTVMNGADREPLPPAGPRDRFVVAFAGMIYLGRNPRPLFRAAARIVEETGATPDEFGVEFLGDETCDGVPLTTMAAEEGLGTHFRSHPFRPRRDAMEFLADASVLVSLPLRTAMTLPAKLFEYVRFDAWVLALSEPGSATAELLRDTGADIAAPTDVDEIAAVIRRRFAEFRSGIRPAAINRDGRFDRETQATHLYDRLDRIIPPATVTKSSGGSSSH